MDTTFKTLKEMALAAKDLDVGRAISWNAYLFYDPLDNTVKIKGKNGILISETDTDNISTLHISNSQIHLYNAYIFNMYLNVQFKKLQGFLGIRQHNEWILVINSEKYIYVPKTTKITEHKIINMPDYFEDIINSKWKNEFTQISKKNRAAFTALHKMIPLEDSTNAADKIGQYDLKSRTDLAVDLVLKTPNPTGEDINNIRTLLCIKSTSFNLRTFLQKAINEQVYERAYKAGKIKTLSTPNYPR